MPSESGLPVLRLDRPDNIAPRRITRAIAAEADHNLVDLFLFGPDGCVTIRGTRAQLLRLLGEAVVDVAADL